MSKGPILITGTTHGIGKSLMRYFVIKNRLVIAVNRRSDRNLEAQFPQVRFVVLDIADDGQVRNLLETLNSEGALPEDFILNAGINRTDNGDRFDLIRFKEVERTNVYGVLSFISAGQHMGLRGRTFLAMGSTATIVPNPKSAAYFLSKHNLEALFPLLQKSNPHNQYKILSLGPVQTNILAESGGPSGFQRTVFDFLAADPDELGPVVQRLLTSRKHRKRFTLLSHCFYFALRFVLRIYPNLYRGTRSVAVGQSK